MNRMKGLIFILLSMSLMLQGCVLLAVGAGAAAGVGTMAYIEGEFQTTYAASLERTWDAGLEALKELGYRVLSTRENEASRDIEARKLGGNKVTVALSIAGPGATLVKIRVGILGDETVSKTIANEITSRLEVSKP